LNDTRICPGDSISLLPIVKGSSTIFKYHWSHNDLSNPEDTLPTFIAKTTGKYTVSYGKPNCITVASSTLNFHPVPDPGTNLESVIFCEEDGSILLDGGIATTYSWFPDGFSQRYLTIDTVGSYMLRIGNEFKCFMNDTVLVENRCAPKLYVPNAFTPELEGGNQVHTIFGYNIGSFELLIFNRWGEIIYESKDIHRPWNGFYRSELMPSGVYSWIIKYTGNNPDYSELRQLEGKVVLVR
jgi:gliding motility-associated-like protein